MKEALFQSVEIEINHGCNLACSYCPNSKLQRNERGDMDPALFHLIIKQLKELDYKGKISFSFYNEPTLNAHLYEFVKHAHEQLPHAFLLLYSNGTKLSEKKINLLFENGLSQLIVTKHEQVVDNVFEKTLAQLPAPIRSKIKFQSFTEINLTNRGGLLDIGSKDNANLLPCFIPQNILTITVKGNVIPCFEDYQQVHQIDNVEKRHLKDIWMDDRYINFRTKLALGLRHQFAVCKNCNRTEVLF